MTFLPSAREPARIAALRTVLPLLRVDRPAARDRDVARLLAVAEAELTAMDCGRGVRRLAAPGGGLLADLAGLGPLRVRLAGEEAELEGEAALPPASPPARGDAALGLKPVYWRHAFAGAWAADGGAPAIRIFDADGAGVCRLSPSEATDPRAWQAIVERHVARDQSPGFAAAPLPGGAPARPDATVDRPALVRGWQALDRVADGNGLLRKLGASRLQALRLLGAPWALSLPTQATEAAFRLASATGMALAMTVSLRGCWLVARGRPTRLGKSDGWLEIDGAGFSLRLRDAGVAAAWHVRQPTRDGLASSLELFDTGGRAALVVEAARAPGRREPADWRRLLVHLASAVTT